MSFDAVSYIMGSAAGRNVIALDGEIVCADDGEGHITITQSAVEEVVSDGE